MTTPRCPVEEERDRLRVALTRIRDLERWSRYDADVIEKTEVQVVRLQTVDYRCERMCAAAQNGGPCRCSELSELSAAEDQVAKLREALLWAYDQFPPEMHGAVHPVLDRALVAETVQEGV